MENLVVQDDPSFGSEPLLRAPEVTAWLKVTSLLRGRMEISSLSLSDASLNLTRSSQGKWNLQDLLERTAAISVAPTGSRKQESRSEFPYIQADGARINFKIGTEKTHFAFTDAQFALWQDSDNTWGMRLKARPIRTDANLTDTGLINVSGAWQRSAAFQQTPLQFSFQWNQAQIGQVSKLIYGNDKGWRGSTIVFGTIAGTPGKLKITTDAAVDDFGRYDVLASDDLRLQVHCVAEYGSAEKRLSAVNCIAPSGGGFLQVKGSASGWPLPAYSLVLTAVKVPLGAVLALTRHTSGRVPDGVTTGGTLTADVGIGHEDNAELIQWGGSGELNDLVVSSGGAAPGLRVARVPLSIISDATPSGALRNRVTENFPRIEIGPVSENLGRPVPLQAHASLSASGYEVSVRGDAGIKRLLKVAELLGLPVPAVSADGSSTVDLSINGAWDKTRRPLVLGTAQLHSVRAQVRGLNAPLEITAANILLDTDVVRAQILSASAAGASWRGSLLIPRPCPVPAECPYQFNLHSAEVDAADLNSLVNPRAGKQSWYGFLTSGNKAKPYLLQARATGKIGIDRLRIGKSVATQFTSEVALDEGTLALTNMRGQALGGRAQGDWKADFRVRPPVYSGNGSFEGASLTEVADLMQNDWIAGTGSAKYQFNGAGWSIQDLLQSARLGASFTLSYPEFPHVVLPNKSGPLRASELSGNIILQDAKFSFRDAKIMTPADVYKLSGTVSLTGTLNLKISDDSVAAYGLSGTLARTRVIPIVNTATQAALKP
jgi:hypothetical protein